MNYDKNSFLRVVLPYAIVGALYIIASDLFAKFSSKEVEDLFLISLLKGLAYVIVTGVLVYFLVRNYTQKILTVNEQYLNIFKFMPEPILILDSKTHKPINANISALKFFGFTKNELTEYTINSLFNPGDGESEIKDFLDEPNSYQGKEFTAITKDYKEHPAFLSSSKMDLGKDGEFMVLVVRDLSEIKLQEQRIIESEKKLNNVLDGVQAVIWWDTYSPYDFFYVSKAVESVFGVSREEIGNNRRFWVDHTIDADKERVKKMLDNLYEGKSRSLQIEYRIQNKQGKIKWIRNRIWADFNVDEVNCRGIIIDITKDKKYESARRIHLSKVENFAFSVAHKVRSPLSNIIGLINLYHESDSKKKEEVIELIRKSSLQLDDEVRTLTNELEESRDSLN